MSGQTNEGQPKLRVLVVDDDRMILVAVRRVLRDYETVCLESAAEALAMIDAGEWFDLILCDLTMPGMDGMEFYGVLAERRPSLASNVVFFTGGPSTPSGRAFLEQIPNDKISKPFEPAELRAFVQRRQLRG